MYDAYALKTIHGTTVYVDSKNNLTQVTPSIEDFSYVDLKSNLIPGASSIGDFSNLYAGKYLDGIYFFFLKQGKIYYISATDKNGKIDLSEYMPILFQTCDNSDGSISIYHDDMYLSARKDGTFSFVPHNKLWEHIYFERTLLEIPPP